MTDIETDMRRYNTQHVITACSNYGIKLEHTDKSHLANYIHDNFDTMDDYEVRHIAYRCLTTNQLKSIVLNHELTHLEYESEEHMSLQTVAQKVIELLQRYQWRAGGYKIEDPQWSLYAHTSKDRHVEENEILLENTIDRDFSMDLETLDFLNKIVRLANQLAHNIYCELRFKDVREDRLSYIYIWLCDDIIAKPKTETVEPSHRTKKQKIGL